MKLPKNDDREFELAPAGNHLAICYQVIDLGTQTVEWQGQIKKQRKIIIGWELPDEKMTDGRPFMISRRYTLSSYHGAKLMEHLNSWRGVPFSDDDYGNFDIQNLIGQPCQINLLHEASKDGTKTYANILAITPKPKGFTERNPPLINDPIYFSLDEPDQVTWDKLPDWMHEVISKSPEFEALNSKDEPEKVVEDAGDEIPF